MINSIIYFTDENIKIFQNLIDKLGLHHETKKYISISSYIKSDLTFLKQFKSNPEYHIISFQTTDTNIFHNK